MDSPDILALDFDGVLCDGLAEYFQSAWQTYTQIWQESDRNDKDTFIPSFSRLRPVIETGWEMPVLLRALALGFSETEILQNWAAIAGKIVTTEQLEAAAIARQLDTVRDNWIRQDIDGWLSLHRFYPGVLEKVRQVLIDGTPQLFIVTTKEGRFVQRLLQQQGIELPRETIIGKESQRPKHETLRQILAAAQGNATLWFVEDRLKTLRSIQHHPDLQTVKLYLATWGYNTEQVRQSAGQDPKIQVLSRQQFAKDFSAWA